MKFLKFSKRDGCCYKSWCKATRNKRTGSCILNFFLQEVGLPSKFEILVYILAVIPFSLIFAIKNSSSQNHHPPTGQQPPTSLLLTHQPPTTDYQPTDLIRTNPPTTDYRLTDSDRYSTDFLTTNSPTTNPLTVPPPIHLLYYVITII